MNFSPELSAIAAGEGSPVRTAIIIRLTLYNMVENASHQLRSFLTETKSKEYRRVGTDLPNIGTGCAKVEIDMDRIKQAGGLLGDLDVAERGRFKQ